MARKSPAVLKSAVLPLSKLDVQLLGKLKEFPGHPIEGCEEQWQRYILAVEANAQSWAKIDALAKVVDKKGSNHPDWPAYKAAMADQERTSRAEFGAYDAYHYAVKHRFDKIGAPVEDVRAIVKDTLQAALADGELQFNNNFGLLASHVANAIRPLTSEEDLGIPPLCPECGKED